MKADKSTILIVILVLIIIVLIMAIAYSLIEVTVLDPDSLNNITIQLNVT